MIRDILILLKKIETKINFIDPEFSVHRSTNYFDGCISLPFTSTSKIYKSLGKKAVFYDPLNYFNKDHKAAKNIELLHFNDLDKWIGNL